MKSKILGLLAVGLLAGPMAANAVVVNYQESVSGDLSANSSPLTIFSLGAGANTVSGRTGFTLSGTDFDSFGFTLASGLTLLSVQVDLIDSIGDMTYATWHFRAGSTDFGGGASAGSLSPYSPGTAVISGSFGPDSYNISANSFEGFLPAFSGHYIFTLSVRGSSVPEPGSLALLCLGLLGLGVSRRRNA